MKLIDLSSVPIGEQLRLEEALFRADKGNYCLINRKSTPALVMGLSTKIEEVIHLDQLGSIPVWRRFSGGGTVVIDEETLFVTFIGNASDFELNPYPHDLFNWSAIFYKEVFSPHPFVLKENDYVIEGKKMGGNAQAFARDRFVHHTSFLWDYRRERMDLLKMPPRMPSYREGREHSSFLTTIKNLFESPEDFFERVEAAWSLRYGKEKGVWSDFSKVLEKEHRKALKKETA